MFNIFNIFRSKSIAQPTTQVKDTLTFYYEYEVHRDYSSRSKRKTKLLSEILTIFKKNSTPPTISNVYVQCKYNDIVYPMFDLDTIEHKDTFTSIYKDVPYVMFQSSVDHHWAMLGTEDKNIFTDTIWLSCNDPKFADVAKSRNAFMIRGLYENMVRKPVVVKINGILDINFKVFIEKLEHFYSNEGLELSVLKYKEPNMILKFDRKNKLEQLNRIS
jgi:hypothetical protein